MDYYTLPDCHVLCSARYNVQPLPSSGIVSVMQAFCDSSRTDEHGFPEFPRST